MSSLLIETTLAPALMPERDASESDRTCVIVATPLRHSAQRSAPDGTRRQDDGVFVLSCECGSYNSSTTFSSRPTNSSRVFTRVRSAPYNLAISRHTVAFLSK